MPISPYPDWVLKHKPKGVYVLKKKDAYYLYRAHSERIICADIYKSFKKSHRSYADSIFASAIFNVSSLDIAYLHHDALSLLLPNFSFNHLDDPLLIEQIDCCTSMISYYLEHKVDPDDLVLIKKILPSIHLVYVNDSYRLSSFDSQVQSILDKYHVEVTHYVKSL